ncbi:ADP-ribosylglycohydrolase family protein [Catenulispora subtropica]|uniref:ADP-ribosylglycohydrolase family protein n=1 Tax=Catenulispora subtropica TaxID=450798 RepID=A0ABP5C591_9ACTN
MDALERKAVGALAGAAVGDALGGATEGWSPAQIRERHGGPVRGIVGPFLPDWRTARPASPYHKGDGHVTDDTLMTNLLVRVYADKRDHLDAYDVAERLVPLINGEVVWIPELERETVPLIRLFLAEKWLVTRLHYGHVDPREAGVGNVVNCGAAMYCAPIGVANAANPAAAYAEAIEVAGAHQSSYGREAAGVFAAAVAAAFRPGATVTGLVDTALALAHDGTRAAIEAVCERAAKLATAGVPCDDASAPLRAAMEPFDTVGPEYRNPGLGARRPSRLHAIEELPLALGMLVLAGGDYTDAVLGGVNYGRDSDSIATMAGALSGALHGVDAVPAEWREAVGTASRLDLAASGLTMAAVAREIHAADQRRRTEAAEAFAAVAAEA